MLSPDFKEFIKLLNDHNVKYLIVGGYALAFHGHPRYTKDIDVWIESSMDNADKLLKVLSDFGFESIELSSSDFLVSDNVIQLGLPPNRIDILTSVDGINFGESSSKAKVITIDNIAIHLIGINDLITNKMASGRLQDLADVEKLKEILKNQEQNR